MDVSRNAIGFVTRGAAFGGCPLYRKPPPTAVEIGAAFVENVLSRAEAAAIALTSEEAEVIRTWLAEPQSDPEEQRVSRCLPECSQDAFSFGWFSPTMRTTLPFPTGAAVPGPGSGNRRGGL